MVIWLMVVKMVLYSLVDDLDRVSRNRIKFFSRSLLDIIDWSLLA